MPAVEGHLADKGMHLVIDQVLGNQDAVVRQANHQCSLGLGAGEADKGDGYSVDGFDARHDDMVWTLGVGRNGVSMFLALLSGDTVADSFDFGFDLGEGVIWRRESGRAKNMVGVIVREVEPSDGFGELFGVRDDLARVGQHVLSVDDEELRWQLDDVGIGPPAIVRSSVGVDGEVLVLS